MSPNFDRYIGIDWAGAIGPHLPGLQVAVCEPGRTNPELRSPDGGGNWSREQLFNWLIQQTRNTKTLIGMDFAFTYPYLDHNAYFPGHARTPISAKNLWNLVDAECQGVPNFYGGPFFNHSDAPFAPYLCYQTYTGPLFDNGRSRRTERACREIGLRPSSVFKCVGPGQVGTGSVAGMHFLHRISNHSLIWPFDPLEEGKSAIVEIYPRLFYKLAEINDAFGQEWRHINEAFPNATRDEQDALISAAALRHLAAKRKAGIRQGWTQKRDSTRAGFSGQGVRAYDRR